MLKIEGKQTTGKRSLVVSSPSSEPFASGNSKDAARYTQSDVPTIEKPLSQLLRKSGPFHLMG